jgi:hypothetical protein
MAIDQFYFDIDDAKLAVWTATSTYNTAIDLMGVSDLKIDMQTVNAELPGDASIVDSHARGVKAVVTCKIAMYNLAPWAAITGETVISSTGREILKIGNFNPPYIGLIGQTKATNGTGDMHLWLPKMKLMSGFQLQGSYGNYATPEITFTALMDGAEKIFQLIPHSTATALVIPPVNTGS